MIDMNNTSEEIQTSGEKDNIFQSGKDNVNVFSSPAFISFRAPLFTPNAQKTTTTFSRSHRYDTCCSNDVSATHLHSELYCPTENGTLFVGVRHESI